MKAVMVEEATVQEENNDIIHLWEPLAFQIDEHYSYLPKGIFFSFFSNFIYYGIAYPVLTLLTKLIYDFKIEGKENIATLKGGAVSVSNHVLFLDCAMVGLAYRFHKVYYTTREGSFKIPFVRRLIKLLRAIPIPKERKNKKNFIKAINSILEKGEAVHFYPEAALWTYCEKIRNFKEGAFDFAVRQHVPIIPMVFQFRTPQGIRKFFKRKKDVTLIILKPVMPEKGENKRDFKDRIQQQMKEVLEKEAY